MIDNVKKNLFKVTLTVMSILLLATGCGPTDIVEDPVINNENQEVVEENKENKDENLDEIKESEPEPEKQPDKETGTVSNSLGEPDTSNHKLIKVDGGDTSGHREANVVVNIGHGPNRNYWGYTNEHGQLVRVTAKEIILQNDDTEDVTSSGRYYHKMADVPGVGEKYGNDRGHVIADSLGGVSNAYNITPQDATLNRHGDQAYMERNIRQAGGATNFEAIITYPNTKTQIPSSYRIAYTIKGNSVVDDFPNGNPDKINEDLGITTPIETPSESKGELTEDDLSSIDTNGNGRVTIQEAKDAGFSMPIYEDHWLYKYMTDRNNNGMVGE